MKSVPLVLTILAAVAVSAWLLDSDPTPPPPAAGGDTGADDRAAPPSATLPPADVPLSPADETSPGAAPHAEQPETAPPVVRRTLPLADKYIENATWNDESAVIVLEHLAQAAGKRLELSRSMQARLARIRVTLERGRTPVPKALDLVLQPHTMSWYVKHGAIVVFDNDD